MALLFMCERDVEIETYGDGVVRSTRYLCAIKRALGAQEHVPWTSREPSLQTLHLIHNLFPREIRDMVNKIRLRSEVDHFHVLTKRDRLRTTIIYGLPTTTH